MCGGGGGACRLGCIGINIEVFFCKVLIELAIRAFPARDEDGGDWTPIGFPVSPFELLPAFAFTTFEGDDAELLTKFGTLARSPQ